MMPTSRLEMSVEDVPLGPDSVASNNLSYALRLSAGYWLCLFITSTSLVPVMDTVQQNLRHRDRDKSDCRKLGTTIGECGAVLS